MSKIVELKQHELNAVAGGATWAQIGSDIGAIVGMIVAINILPIMIAGYARIKIRCGCPSLTEINDVECVDRNKAIYSICDNIGDYSPKALPGVAGSIGYVALTMATVVGGVLIGAAVGRYFD